MYGKTLLPSIFIAIFSIFSAQCELPPEHPEVGLAPLVHPVGFPVIPEYKSSPLSGRWVWPLDHQSTSILNTRRWTQWFLFSLKEEKKHSAMKSEKSAILGYNLISEDYCLIKF